MTVDRNIISGSTIDNVVALDGKQHVVATFTDKEAASAGTNQHIVSNISV